MNFNVKEILGISEVRTLKLWKAVLAEFIASIYFVIIACGTTINPVPVPNIDPQITSSDLLPALIAARTAKEPSVLLVSLTVGLTVVILATIFWRVSGGHFNPAVTIGLTCVGKVPVIRCVLYVVAQFCGSIVGAALLYAYLPPALRGKLGALALNPHIRPGYGLMLEITLTYQFILCVSASTDPANNFTGFQAPLAIGLSIATGLMMAIPFTGGALNPIRAFGPAVVMNNRKDHWVYWIGPIIGGILATLSYKYVFSERVVIEDTTDSGPSATVVVKNDNAYEHGGRNESEF